MIIYKSLSIKSKQKTIMVSYDRSIQNIMRKCCQYLVRKCHRERLLFQFIIQFRLSEGLIRCYEYT